MSDSAARSNRPRKLNYPYMNSADINKHRYTFEKLSGQPLVFRVASTVLALPSVAQGQTDFMYTPAGNYWEMFQTTAQTLNPSWVAGSGLEIGLDQVDNESVEYVLGGNNSANPFAFVVGTDPDFFFRVTLTVTDASGSDQTIIGFRKQEAFAVPTAFLAAGDGIYTDFFGIGFAGTKADPNPVRIVSDVGNSGSSSVSAANFTWADGKTHQLEVRVIGGKAYAFINGVFLGDSISKDALGGAITAQQTVSGPSYTFTSGLTLVPFVFSRQDADLTDSTYLYSYECGLLRDIGKDKNAEGRGE